MNEEQLKDINDTLLKVVFNAVLVSLCKGTDLQLTSAQYKKDSIPEIRITLPGGDLVITITTEWQSGEGKHHANR